MTFIMTKIYLNPAYRIIPRFQGSASNNIYKTTDKTLIYVHKSGSLIIYQTTDGYDIAANHIKTIAGNLAEYVNFYLFFPLVGNTIKRFEFYVHLSTILQEIIRNNNISLQL